MVWQGIPPLGNCPCLLANPQSIEFAYCLQSIVALCELELGLVCSYQQTYLQRYLLPLIIEVFRYVCNSGCSWDDLLLYLAHCGLLAYTGLE